MSGYWLAVAKCGYTLGESDYQATFDGLVRALAKLLASRSFLKLFTFVQALEKKKYRIDNKPSDVKKYCRKLWSQFGDVHTEFVVNDPGNGKYALLMDTLVFHLQTLPKSWKLLSGVVPYMNVWASKGEASREKKN